MKRIIVLTLSTVMLTSIAIAANSPQPSNAGQQGKSGQPGPNFAAHKQEILNKLAHRIQRLQAAQSCVQNAQNRQSLMACREQFRGNSNGQQ